MSKNRTSTTEWDYYCCYNLPGAIPVDCTAGAYCFNQAVTSTTSTNADNGNFIDNYHGITTSRAREAYTMWTDSRNVSSNSNYNIYADRTKS